MMLVSSFALWQDRHVSVVKLLQTFETRVYFSRKPIVEDMELNDYIVVDNDVVDIKPVRDELWLLDKFRVPCQAIKFVGDNVVLTNIGQYESKGLADNSTTIQPMGFDGNIDLDLPVNTLTITCNQCRQSLAASDLEVNPKSGQIWGCWRCGSKSINRHSNA